MTVRRLLGAGAFALLAATAAVFIYMNFIRADAPDAFALSADGSAAADKGAGEPITSMVDLDGTWKLTAGSQAGYRVVEDFAGGLQNFEAVGRGSDIEGSLAFEGDRLVTAEFVIDVGTIVSDDATRDDRFHRPIMNVAEFPTARFVLTSPVTLAAFPAPGEPLSTIATGELTLRDETRSVPVTLNAQVLGSTIEVVGSVPVVFADFGIANPSIERVISVRDEGLVEFQLVFSR